MADRRSPLRGRRVRAMGGPLTVAALGALGAFMLAGVFADVVAPYSPTSVDARAVFQGPSLAHPFGTDRFGRDVLAAIGMIRSQ